MALPKGRTNNKKGRPKGVPNKTTKQVKEELVRIIKAQSGNVDAAFIELYKKDKHKYLEVLYKYLNFVMPTKTDVTSGGESIGININVIDVDSKPEIENVGDRTNESI